jgi:O-antigen ligase
MGLGFDAFRRGCADPAAVQGLPWLGVSLAQARAATDACNIHPHNYYLEAADNGGVPLLLLFIAMVGAAGLSLSRGKLDAMRAGLLVGFVLAFWPLASTSAFTSMPNAGWIFLLLGLALAAREA